MTPPPHRPHHKEHRKTFSSDLCGLARELRTEMKFSAECFHFFPSPESRMKVVKVSRSFNLCTFCLKSPFHIILSGLLFPPISRIYFHPKTRIHFLFRPFRLKGPRRVSVKGFYVSQRRKNWMFVRVHVAALASFVSI